MGLYKTKVVYKEAEQYTKDKFINDYSYWFIDALIKGILYIGTDDLLHIRTLEGDVIASEGDYIIKGVDSELYPCKPDIFEKTYEKVDDDTREDSAK